MEPLEANVTRGANLLDEKEPGWYRQIEPSTLQMNHGDKCVCGQLFDGYGKGLRALGIRMKDGEHYGFNSVGPGYLKLRKLWIEEVELRKIAAASLVETPELLCV